MSRHRSSWGSTPAVPAAHTHGGWVLEGDSAREGGSLWVTAGARRPAWRKEASVAQHSVLPKDQPETHFPLSSPNENGTEQGVGLARLPLVEGDQVSQARGTYSTPVGVRDEETVPRCRPRGPCPGQHPATSKKVTASFCRAGYATSLPSGHLPAPSLVTGSHSSSK